MASSVSDKERILEAVSYGASDYIVKPVTKEVLVEKIEAQLKF